MPLACPACGMDVRGEAVNIMLDTACCPRCGETFVPSAVLHAEGPGPADHPAEPPPGLDVIRSPDGGIQVTVPRTGFTSQGAGMVLFAVLWNLFSWAMFGGFVLSARSDMPAFVLPLVSLFPLIGIVLIIIVLWMMFGTTTVDLSWQGLTVTRRLFGWERRIEATLAQIEGFGQEVVYAQDDKPVLGVAVHIGKRQRKFGTSLTETAREWLVDELNAVLKALR